MKYVALILGIALLALGLATFFPAAMVDGVLFGLVPITVEESLMLIAAGALGVMAGLSRTRELEQPQPTGHDLREWVA
jgi:hypothetical protein